MKRLLWSITFLAVALLVAIAVKLPPRMSVAPVVEKKTAPPDVPLYSVMYELPRFEAEEIFVDCKGPPTRFIRVNNTIWHTFDVPKKGECK